MRLGFFVLQMMLTVVLLYISMIVFILQIFFVITEVVVF